MFQIGDFVVYKSIGVCKVTDIAKPDFIRTGENRLYYILHPLYRADIIYTPVDTKAFMRPIITAEEAEYLIDMMPSITAEVYQNSNAQMLAAHYEYILSSHKCLDYIRLTKSIYTKKQALQLQNHKPSQIDERFMAYAEELLFGELAAAIGIPINSVKDYISARLANI